MSSASPAPGAAALQDLLAVEHLAVFGYGLVGGRLGGAEQVLAAECLTAHRARRDALVLRLGELGASPVAAEAAYAEVTGGRPPAVLAAALEEQVAGVALTVTGATSDAGLRRTALATLTDAALRAARWRSAAGVTPVSGAFPGRAG